MAPEPAHLVGIVKVCPRCSCWENKFAYFNNGKPNQPRYKCFGPCLRHFQYGGGFRKNLRPKSQPMKRPRSRIWVAGDRGARVAKSKPVERPRRHDQLEACGVRRSARIAQSKEPGLPLPASSLGTARCRTGSPVDVVVDRRITRITKFQLVLPPGNRPTGSPVGVAVDGRIAQVDWVKAVLGASDTHGLVSSRKELRQVKIKFVLGISDAHGVVSPRKELRQVKIKVAGRESVRMGLFSGESLEDLLES